MADRFTCPQCGMTSYNPNDIRESYCGNCHQWTGDPDAWWIGGPCVAPCNYCGMPGDVECISECENKDFRDAEFDAVLEQSD